MTADATIHISRLAPNDADELLAFIRRLQRDDPLRPVTVVAPSNYALLSLRHTLGRAGFANVQFMVFPRLAELLGAPTLSARGMRPLTSIFNSAVVRVVASQAEGALAPLREHPSTHITLRRTFAQLRHAENDALDSLERQGGLRAETVTLYRQYIKRIGDLNLYDDEDVAQAAAEAVRDNRAHGLRDLGFIIFFRVRGLTPAQRALTRALAEAGQCAMLLGETGDDHADTSTHALARELRPSLGEPHAPSDDTQAHADAANAHLLIAPDAHQELRWVIRRIMRRAESGTPFHRIAVLYRKDAPYGALIREELTLAGIPVAGPNPTSLADGAVGGALTGLMNLHDAEFARDTVMAWLTGCPLKPPPDMDAMVFNPTLWDVISKRAGVVRGAEQWETRLSRFADNLEREASDTQGELSDARIFRMRSDAVAARQLMRFVADLAQRATPPIANASWARFSDWAKELLDRYLVDNLPDEGEQRAYARIERILDELKSADEISADAWDGVSFDVFKRALNEALQASVGHLGAVGHGVFVAPLRLAAAMNFDVVHLVGMIEGAVPPAMRDDPLIPDRDRMNAGGAAAGLPLQQQRKDDERYEYLAALATAPEHTLSYPVADPAGQRGNYPSRWMLERASQLAGSQVFASTLHELGGRDWLTIVPSMERSFDMPPDDAHADMHDYNMERLQAWKSAGLDAASHELANEGVLAASMRLSAARQGRDFTEWDGNLSAVSDYLSDTLSGRALSPTGLERWAKCPFSYFLGTVLRLSADENPEDIYTLSALERGSLVHDILEEFIDGARKANGLPGVGEEWSDAARRELRRIAADRFADAETRGVTGKSVMWQIARDEMLTDLDAFLDADARLRERFGVSPIGVEACFGIGDDGWRPAEYTLADGASIAFRGKIDRIDADENGKRALVLDYKTGGASSYAALTGTRNTPADPIDKGKRLQLVIYSLAARQELGDDTDVSAAYWFVSYAGKFELAPKEPLQIADEDVLERFRQGITTIIEGIKGGMFPANPGPGNPNDSRNYQSNCRYCDFKTLCPSRRDVQWNRKSGASKLADYLDLNGYET